MVVLNTTIVGCFFVVDIFCAVSFYQCEKNGFGADFIFYHELVLKNEDVQANIVFE